MTASTIGRLLGPAIFAITALTSAPDGMPQEAWLVAGLVVWMASWWMTEAIPLTATALLPFIILPFSGVASAKETAATYYSPILFLILGGAFVALAIERTGLHKRLSLAILSFVGAGGGQTRLLLAFMISAAVLSMMISNTSTSLIMMPMALAVLAGGAQLHGAKPPSPSALPPGTVSDTIRAEGRREREATEPESSKEGLSGALPMGIAFAASIGGLGTLVGSPTNAIAVELLDTMIGVEISFLEWSLYGIPIVIVGVPLAAWIIAKVQRVEEHPFDVASARQAIATQATWTTPEKRLVPIVTLTFLAWLTVPWVEEMLPAGSWTNGTIAILAGFALFLLPDGTGRPLLIWKEADRAPWGVIMMFGGGLALAAGMQTSGLADWLGQALLPLENLPLIVVALCLTAMVVLITEFASNVATASGIIPVVAALIVALGADPILLAMPAALAASWGFMLPAGTGPNAIAWATGRIRIERMVGAGLILDVIGIFVIVGMVWAIAGIV